MNVFQAATWVPMERNAVWHRKLGVTYSTLKILDEAESSFQRSLAMDANDFVSLSCISRVYETKPNHRRSIHFGIRARESLRRTILTEAPEDEFQRSLMHEILERLAIAYHLERNTTQALRNVQQAKRYDKDCLFCIEAGMRIDFEQGSFEEVVMKFDTIQTATRESQTDHNPAAEYLWLFHCTRLACYNWSVTDNFLAEAARRIGKLSVVTAAFSDVIQYQKNKRHDLALHVMTIAKTDIDYRYFEKIDDACRIWRNIVDVSPKCSSSEPVVFSRTLARARLAEHELRSICADEKANLSGSITTLLSLIDRPETDLDKFDYQRPDRRLGVRLALCYRLAGRLDEANDILCPLLQTTICWDPRTVDEFAYFISLRLAAGEYEEVQCLFDLYQWSIRDGKDDNDIEPALWDEEYDARPFTFSGNYACDGICCRSLNGELEFALCRYCLEKKFCTSCLALLKEDHMPLNVCSPIHAWLMITPPKKPRKRYHVLLSNEYVDTREHEMRLWMRWDQSSK